MTIILALQQYTYKIEIAVAHYFVSQLKKIQMQTPEGRD
jgi:hypothetical protein